MSVIQSKLVRLVLTTSLGAGCSLLSATEPADCTVDSQCEDFFGPGSVCEPGGSCSASTGERDLQIGMLYVGPVGDHGWTKTHDQSREYVLDHLEGASAMFAPSVSATDAPDRIKEFVARGDNVIIGTSFDFLVPLQAAALDYPEVDFLLVSGFQTGPNLGSYSGRMYQVLYQAGQLAGKMSNTGVVGVVGSVTIPETVSHTNAFARGVLAANPDAKVMIRWVGAWFDPPEETAAANELIDAGCDVILGQTDTTIPIETANARSTADAPIYTIGYDNEDSCKYAKETCLTSAYWNWGPVLTDILQQIQTDTWDPEQYIWQQMQADPSESVAYLAPLNEKLVSSSIRIEVELLVDDLSEHTETARMLPFRGPLADSTGKTRFAAAALPKDEDVLKMCWFVDGVVDLEGNPAEVPAGCPGDP